jgi:alpha-amylase/alpha-mannosidase (GH57 family)
MLKIAFLWHMHQPYYRDPATGKMFLPWVRLHCLKDYYDLPARVGRFDRLKMTFNLVPSLIEQIDLYCSRQTTDRHLELTVKPAAQLDRQEKAEIFSTFFAANPATMIEIHPRFRRLHKKLKDCGLDAELAARTSSIQEIRDLTVWSNLAWVDPIFHGRAPFKNLIEKGEMFTEEDKSELVAAQYAIMADIIPTYRDLMADGKIEVSFTPYFHPILPLLCDTDSAKEALPGITLPQNRFRHPEDAERQVAMAIEMYHDKFGADLKGVWPSEGSISEEMAVILARHGVAWMASDEQVLYGSLAKSGDTTAKPSPHLVYRHATPSGPISIFFRDHTLSDRIGFVYSGWDEEKAVDDFIGHLRRLGEFLGWEREDVVVPIILDGENCWEYYPHDGDKFLNLLFEKLATDTRLETVTMGEAAAKLRPLPLPRLMAGSWINHNFRVWIGHPEDNTSWDLLWKARQALANFKRDHPDFSPEKLAIAEKSLLVAEGSDWNWWYGDEHRGPHIEVFDRIYRTHLSNIYTTLGLEPPAVLLVPISSGLPETYLTEADGTATPTIDGRLTSYYEWVGAGKYDCTKAGGAMHRVDRILSQIHFVSDDDFVYIRVDFSQKSFLLDNPTKRLKVDIVKPVKGEFLFGPDGIDAIPEWVKDKTEVLFGCQELVEIGFKKMLFFPDGRGEIYFRIGMAEAGRELEIWPPVDPIRFALSGRGESMVWDL